MDALTQATQSFVNTFAGFVNQFVTWGQWIFGTLLVINLLYLWLQYAFDKESIAQGLSDFIKRFFIALVFYTLLVNPSWIMSLLKTANVMGETLTGLPIDPSSIVSTGIMIGNKILIPIEESSILTMGFGMLVVFVVYLVVLFAFISVALELALTLIITTALISMASFFLGFAALNATSNIARQTLDVILGNCVKLLGIYLVVAAGARTITAITAAIPPKLLNFDGYTWIAAAALLFWLLAKHLPLQLARIFSGAIHEHHGTDAAAIAMAGIRYYQATQPATQIAKIAAKSTGIGIAASAATNAAARFSLNPSLKGAVGTAAGTAGEVLKASSGTLADHYRHIANKMAGGPGIAASHSDIPGVSQRLYESSQQLRNARSGSNTSSSGTAETSVSSASNQ